MQRKNNTTAKIVKFSTGAVRDENGFNFHFHSVSPYGLRRLAMIHHEGDTRYGYNNWRKGMPHSNIINHLINHLMIYLQEGNRNQDNLAKIAWACFTLMEFEAVYGQKFNDLPSVFLENYLAEKDKKKHVRSAAIRKRNR